MHITGDVASHCRGITGASPDITGDVASHYRRITGASPHCRECSESLPAYYRGVTRHYRGCSESLPTYYRTDCGTSPWSYIYASHCMGRQLREVHARTCRGYIEIVYGAHSKEGTVHDRCCSLYGPVTRTLNHKTRTNPLGTRKP